MTNITLSIDDKIYRRMRRHSEIKWSEFVRKAIERRINELERIEEKPDQESVFTMLASEDVLKKEWENEYDEQWNNI